jgi:hypothetical protein
LLAGLADGRGYIDRAFFLHVEALAQRVQCRLDGGQRRGSPPRARCEVLGSDPRVADSDIDVGEGDSEVPGD